LYELFQNMLAQEQSVTFSVNSTMQECLAHNDHITYSFIQWYAAEQVQEESVAKSILDRLAIIGDDKGGLYNFDKDIVSIRIM
jgi:ferritin